MPFVEWNDSLSVGIDEIDEDHKKLVALLNELHDAVEAGAGHTVLGKVLEGLILYVSHHFGHEEGLFLRAQYPGYEEHKREHEELTAQVKAVYDKFNSDPEGMLALEVLDFLKDWLYIHIMKSDRQFGVYLNAHQDNS